MKQTASSLRGNASPRPAVRPGAPRHLLFSTGTAACLAVASCAGEPPFPVSDSFDAAATPAYDGPSAASIGRVQRIRDLVGLEIRNFQNQPLGRVEDLALDLESGRVLAVFLATGGLLGLGERTHWVASGGFHREGDRRVVHLDQSQDAVNAMPLLDASNWRTCCNPGKGADEGPPVGGTSGTAANPGDRGAGADHLQKASQVLGLMVGNAQGQTVGPVENVVVDLPAGRIVAVVIASGRFLGLGDELSAVPAAALRFNEDRTALRLDASRETLRNAPHFRAGQWPDFSQRVYATRVHQAYRITPYFDTNSVTGHVMPGPGPASGDVRRP